MKLFGVLPLLCGLMLCMYFNKIEMYTYGWHWMIGVVSGICYTVLINWKEEEKSNE